MSALFPSGNAYVLLFAVLVCVGFNCVSIYYCTVQSNDCFRQKIKFTQNSKRSIALIAKDIPFKFVQLKIPAEQKKIKAEHDGPFFALEVSYVVPFGLRIYQHALELESCWSGQTFAQ